METLWSPLLSRRQPLHSGGPQKGMGWTGKRPEHVCLRPNLGQLKTARRTGYPRYGEALWSWSAAPTQFVLLHRFNHGGGGAATVCFPRRDRGGELTEPVQSPATQS